MADEGIRITNNVAAGLLDNVTVTGAGLSGVYITGSFGTLEAITATGDGLAGTSYDPSMTAGLYVSGPVTDIAGGVFANDAGYGVYLTNAGAVTVTGLTIDGNRYGFHIDSSTAAGAVVGALNLALNDGNIIFGNTLLGLYASGNVLVAGNTVYDQTGAQDYGIYVTSGASAQENVVYGSQDGIDGVYAGIISANRVYSNVRGIDDYGSSSAVSDNVAYGNATGIEIDTSNTSITPVTNDLVYANTVVGILVSGGPAVAIVSDTVDTQQGIGVEVETGNSNTVLRDDIIVAGGTASGIVVAPDSETGFQSDYNLFQVSATASVGTWQGVLRATLPLWEEATTTDADSFVANPLFVSATASDLADDDFHLQSQYGSTHGGSLAPLVSVTTGLPVFPVSTAVDDRGTSPGIDRGAASDPYANEPSPNGGYINLGAYGNTLQASTSPAQYILVLQPSATTTVQVGTSDTITWRAYGFTGTVSLSVSADGGATFTPIVSGVADSGSYVWSVPAGLTPGTTYVVQVSADSAPVTGLSAEFAISSRIHAYYVDDGSLAGNQYTTAPGNDANDGLTPNTPKATIQGILAAYTLGAGDIIYVDTGTYSVTTSITLTSAVSGTDTNDRFQIIGPTVAGDTATLDRGNQSSGTTVFTVTNAAYVSIDNLVIQDAATGIEVTGPTVALQLLNDTISNTMFDALAIDANSGATGLDIEAERVYGGSSGDGIYIGSGNTGALIANDTASGGYYGFDIQGTNDTVQGGSATGGFYGGLQALSSTSLVEGFTAYSNSHYGIFSQGTVTGSVAFDNASGGIDVSGGTVMGSTAYGQPTGIVLSNGAIGSGNLVYLDTDGLSVYSTATATDNRAYDNSDAGIVLGGADNSQNVISDNSIYGNGTGIDGNLYTGFGNDSGALIENNVIYENTVAGIGLTNGRGIAVINNTIDQVGGPGFVSYSGAVNTTIENNIFVASGGPAISVGASSEVGFVSDYNVFDPDATGSIGVWEGLTYSSLASWYYEIGLDQHSQVGDPGFVDPAGSDGVLGFTPITAATPTVIDNSGAGFSVSGPTTTRNDGVDGSSLIIAAGSSTVATWTFTGLVTGEAYQLAAIWPGNGSYYQSYGTAVYDAVDGSGRFIGGRGLDQEVGPNPNYDGVVTDDGYAVIGTFIASIGTLTVSLGSAAAAPVLADAVELTLLGVNNGADDNLTATAAIIVDAGNPASVAIAEPSPNGGRVNTGAQGGTASALTSLDPEVQVLSPAGLAKLQLGQQATIDFRTYDVAAEQPVLLDHAGGSAITTEEQGDWQGDAYRLNGSTYTDTTTVTSVPASLPAALFQTGAAANSGTGNELSFQLPVANGTYTLRLFFADPSASGVGQRLFDVVGNGTTLVSGVDVFAATGVQNQAYELDVTVTVTGGKGLSLNLVNDADTGNLGAFVDGIELDHVVPGGAASPTASIQVSTDAGATWSTIATNVAVNRFGLGQFVWTVDRTTVGNTALIRVTSGTTSGVSSAFLLANNGPAFYVNDGSQVGDQYTTAVGNDANSGKSPDQPVASLGALLRAYTLQPGDTVYVDTGNYTLATDLTLGAADSGSGTAAAAQVLITGPTNGGLAVLNRANTASGTAVFHVAASDVTISNLQLENAATVVDVTGGAGLLLQNDTLQGSASQGVDLETNVTNFTLVGSTLRGNTNQGILINSGNTGALLSNDLFYANGYQGIDVDGAGDTISGVTVYGNGLTYPFSGIEADSTDSLVTGAVVFGNVRDGIYSRGTVTNTTAFGNGQNEIEDSGGTVTGSLVYGENATYQASGGLVLENGALATGNVATLDVDGIYVGSGSTATNNRVYANSDAGVTLGYGSTDTLRGNTIYGNGQGIDGDLYNYGYSAPTSSTAIIENNLIYQNTTAGIDFGSGTNVAYVNNTIQQAGGPAIAVTHYGNDEDIENNIFLVTGSPTITVDPTSEPGIVSDYNLFDLTAGATPGSFGGQDYTSLATWYYEVGLDQDSELADPALVAPAGADGIEGYAPATGATATVIDSVNAGFKVTGATATATRPDGTGGSAVVIPAGSNATATWTFTGLVAGESYQLAATWPGSYQSGYGNANYVETDAAGHVLAGNYFNQYNAPSGSNVALPNNYADIGSFVATGSTVTVTLTSLAGSAVIADAVSLTALGTDHGADDNFQIAAGSPAVDAGDPATPALLEPSPNGGRVNQGYQGGTAASLPSPTDPEVQVLTPGALSKLQLGQQATIDFRTYDVAAEQPILLDHAGGAAINTAEQGDWQADAYRLNGNTFTDYQTVTGVPASLPPALFQSGVYANSGTGSTVAFQLPVADGTYTVRLFFADPSATGIGQRLFDVVANGTTVASRVDVFAATGVQNAAYELDVTVTVTGGKGLALSLVTDMTNTGLPAFVYGIELDRVVTGGAVAPTANIEVSTDNGNTWSLIASNVPVNRFGLGQFVWTVDRTTAGNTALLRVTSDGVRGVSGALLLANGGTSYYVNDGSTLGDQYTTAVGNDANSGKSPDQPVASLTALLRDYTLHAGDTVYVDTGSYTLPSDLAIGPADSGTGTSAAARVVITGPTDGGLATLDRANLSIGTAALRITASDLTIANLVIEDAQTIVDITAGSGLVLLNDTVQGSAGAVTSNGGLGNGIDVEANDAVTNVTISGSTIRDNASSGVYIQSGYNANLNTGFTLTNDQIYDNLLYGADLEAAAITVSGATVHGNGETYGYAGIYANQADTLITGSQIYGNAGDGVDLRGTISNSTVYSNARTGISATNSATVTNDTVYGQTGTNSGYYGLYLNYGAVGTGDAVYGNAQGVFVGDNASELLDSRVYANTGTGISLGGGGYSGNAALIGNVVYSNAVGIIENAIVNPPYGDTISDNLVYANTSIGIQIIGQAKTLLASNTVYQSVGTAVAISGGARGVSLVDNILDVDEGTIITVASDSETGFASQYNLFYRGAQAAAVLGSYGGTSATTLANWQTLTGQDVTGSKEGNPLFVNIAGADGVLGGPTTSQGGGLDDNFGLYPGSPAIDDGTSYGGVPVTDIAGRARHDDPATPNTGTGYGVFTETDAGASSVTAGTTALWTAGSQLSVTYTLPFAFTLYGTAYTSVAVSGQGFLQFAGPDGTYGQTPSAANLEADLRIAPFWTNSYATTATVSTTATSATFTWTNPSANTSFSATLFSNGTFRFDYGAGNTGDAPVIGVGAGNGRTEVLSVNNGSANLGNADARLYTPSVGETDFDIGAYEFQGNSADKTPPTVVSISTIPAAGGTTALGFTSFAVTFSKPLDTLSATSPANYTLIAAGPDGMFDTVDDIAIPVIPTIDGTGTVVTLTLPGGALANGQYRLTLSGTKAILDVSANKLAGAGGVAGTNFVTTFSVNRTGVQPPAATAQSATVAEYGSVVLTLAATDAAGAPLTYSIATQPAFGTLSAINPTTHQVTYTPTPGIYGADSFVFQAMDNTLGVGQATVSLTVTPVNLAPVAMAQTVSVVPNQQRTIVLQATDTETPGSQLTYAVATPPAHGTLTAVSGNIFTYTPAAGYAGNDSFTFTATDTGNPPGTAGNALTSTPATVSLNVAAIAPHAVNDSYTVLAGFTLRVPAATGVLANDTDADGVAPKATPGYPPPAHGTLALATDGSFVYTPNTGFTGTDSFTYTVADAYAQGNAATVTITVAASPTPVIPPSKGKIPSAPAPVVPVAMTSSIAPVAAVPSIQAAAAAPAAVPAVSVPILSAGVSAAVAAAPVFVVQQPVAIVASSPVPILSAVAVTPAPSAVQTAVVTSVVLSTPVTVAPTPSVMPPIALLDALMVPAMPSIQRLPAALQALLPASGTRAMLDPIFFDTATGEPQGAQTAAADDDWLVFDGLPALPQSAAQARHIAWSARH